MSRHRPALLAFAGWLAAAAIATAAGVAAVRLIDGGGAQALTPQQVAEQLASAPAPAAGSAAASPPPGEARPLSGPGGTVVAACYPDGRAFLVSWTPAEGYRVERVERGPDEHADVRFEGAGGRSEVRVRCAAGQPSARWD